MSDGETLTEKHEAVELDERTKTVCIHNLEIREPEVYDYLAEREIEHRPEVVRQALRMGVQGLQSMRVGRDLDYVQKEFAQLGRQMDDMLAETRNEIEARVSAQIDPDKRDSFGAKLTELVASAKQGFNDLLDTVKTGVEEDFDPAKEHSYTGQMKRRLDEVKEYVDKQFDASYEDGHVGRFLKDIKGYLGPNGAMQTTLEERLSVSQDGSPLALLKNDILTEIQSLRDAVIGEQAVEEKTIEKGYKFEEEVEGKLRELAKPDGDVVEDISTEAVAGSKLGDFLVTRAQGGKMVVEARDRQSISTPAALEDLRQAMDNTQADWGILVSKRPEALSQDARPFNVFPGSRIICAYGDAGDVFDVAYRWARFELLAEEAEAAELDPSVVREQTEAIKQAVKTFAQLKKQTTTINNAAAKINSVADEIKGQIDTAREIIEAHLEAAAQGPNEPNQPHGGS